MQIPTAAALALLFSLASLVGAERKFTITVKAGDHDRRDTVVTFTLPKEAGEIHALRRDGRLVPLQVEKSGEVSFVLADLSKSAQAAYELVTAAPAVPTNLVTASREKSKLRFSLGGRALLEYQAEAGALPRADIKPIYKRGGYLHPLTTLRGQVVTDDFAPNHVHHHGLWGAWTRTEFQGRKPDFWNMGDGKGRVEFVALDDSWSGLVHAGFRARHRYIDMTAPEPVPALNEAWEVKVFAPGARATPAWMFDLVSRQDCATADPLKLPEYHYGGLGLRGHRLWDGKENCRFLTSKGETDRVKAHATRARWCDMWGEIDGAKAGLAILCHPGNHRAPQPMRIHPTEPFFCYAPQQAGAMAITPGETYASRYRIVVHDGPPDAAELDRLWHDYAHPPVVTVSEK